MPFLSSPNSANECLTTDTLLNVTTAICEELGRSYRINFWAALLIHFQSPYRFIEDDDSMTNTYFGRGRRTTRTLTGFSGRMGLEFIAVETSRRLLPILLWRFWLKSL